MILLIEGIILCVVLSLILRFINGYTTFPKAFGFGFLLWTIVNLTNDTKVSGKV